MATVKLFGTLRKYVNGTHQQIPGENVRQVIANLCEMHPPLNEILLENGIIRPHYKITRNGHDISLSVGTETPIEQEDQIAIFSPIAGG